MQPPRPFTPRALAEIAIRCVDFDAMVDFYSGRIGLTRLKGNASDGIVFFDLGPGHAGHTAVLALFASEESDPAELPCAGARSSLHHLALSLSVEKQAAAMAWFDEIGQGYRVEHFGWVGWRGVFLTDPDGNTLELVAYDAAFKSPTS